MRQKVLKIPVLVAVDFLLLQSFDEAFTERIVIGIPRAAHAGNHVVAFQHRDVFGAGVLDTLVGVMHDSRWRLSSRDGHLARCYRYPGCQRAIQRPTNRLALEATEYTGQEDKPVP